MHRATSISGSYGEAQAPICLKPAAPINTNTQIQNPQARWLATALSAAWAATKTIALDTRKYSCVTFDKEAHTPSRSLECDCINMHKNFPSTGAGTTAHVSRSHNHPQPTSQSTSQPTSQPSSQAQNGTPPPLAQARPRSQQSGQNGGSTPTPSLDKAVHARDTCDSQTGNNIVSHG